jgi:hypothetical protein
MWATRIQFSRYILVETPSAHVCPKHCMHFRDVTYEVAYKYSLPSSLYVNCMQLYIKYA